MEILFILSNTVLLLAALFWSCGFLLLFRIRLLSIKKSTLIPPPRISVVIPARNEGKRIPPLLEALWHQTLAPYEVIVVDDESTDNTAAIATKAGGRVIPAPPRPEGWLGKPWACWSGARRATGDLLLFLDADVRLVPEAMGRLVTTYRTHGGVISVMPFHRIERCYENLSSYITLTAMIGLDSFGLFSKTGKPAGCFGPCIMIPRDVYLKSGGHTVVKNEIVEDVALGKQFLKNGLPVYNYGGRGSIEFSMYPEGFRTLVEGWTKNLARGAMLSGRRELFILTLWSAGIIGALVSLFIPPLFFSINRIVLSGSIFLLYAVQMIFHFRRAGNFSFLAGLLFPVPFFFCLVLLARSFLHTYVKKKISWKGRIIRLEKNRETNSLKRKP